MSSSTDGGAIEAAGTLPWRVRRGHTEVALIHRPRYDDWSWPKGKLDPGESWPEAAVRETLEETGLRVRLGLPLPAAHYDVPAKGADKEVRYWAARVVSGAGRLEHEVDAVRWVGLDEAAGLLTYERDADQLAALVKARKAGRLTARPFALVRHAKAVPRKAWSKDDRDRPLDRVGKVQARNLVPLLSAYAFDALLSSSSRRCTQTLRPYARASRKGLATSKWLSEEGFAHSPKKAVRALTRQLDTARRGAICTHGPVLPALLETLAHRASGAAADRLVEAAAENLDKGEVLVSYVTEAGRIVDVERFPPIPDPSAK